MVDWQGTGQSQWGCAVKCGIERHGALAVFHERGSFTLATLLKDPLVLTPLVLTSDHNRSLLQASTESKVVKRKREVLGDIDKRNEYASGAPQPKKTKIVSSSPASRPAKQEENDRESFENFEEEYAYYAAKVRRLLGEDPTRPRTYPRTTNTSTNTGAKPVTAQSSTRAPTTTSTAAVKPFTVPPRLPSRPPFSHQTHALQYGDFPPAAKPPAKPQGVTRVNVAYLEEIRICLPPNEASLGLAEGKDNGDCGCSTILCVHRAGARQSVKDVSMDRRR